MPACCSGAANAPPSPTPMRRGLAVLQWATPIISFALIPKCPMCLAAYVALWTGIGLSLAAATYLRWALIALCILSLAYLAAMRVRRAFIRHSHP